ncbi:hypothetical protein M5K25_015667 [Dendrobium thyrsiflorum]|uniref:Uncharacterized protein n=1 Tax=Dendrobium thyrsiflorum TaxID=117978 RepID=A0ABD0URN6_DENTH
MESQLGRLGEMIKKFMEMQSKAPSAIQIAKPQHDLTRVPLTESKGKEIGWEEFGEVSFFHQEPSPGAPRRGGFGFPNEGARRIESDLQATQKRRDQHKRKSIEEDSQSNQSEGSNGKRPKSGHDGVSSSVASRAMEACTKCEGFIR